MRARELHTLVGHSDRIRNVALSGDGRLAVSGSDDTTLKIWDVENGVEPRTIEGHYDRVIGVTLGKDGQLAVSASYDQMLKVWEVASGELLATFTSDGGLLCCALAENGNLIIAGDSGGHVHFLRLEEPNPKN